MLNYIVADDYILPLKLLNIQLSWTLCLLPPCGEKKLSMILSTSISLDTIYIAKKKKIEKGNWNCEQQQIKLLEKYPTSLQAHRGQGCCHIHLHVPSVSGTCRL